MNKKRIQIIIKHQSQLILNSLTSLEYLLNCSTYFQKISENLQPRDLSFVYHLSKDIIILNITKLLNTGENYSFNVLNTEIYKHNDKNNSDLNSYQKELKSANKLYRSLNIYEIRRKHVGHLDYNRLKITISWEEVKTLMQHICNAHNELNQLLFKTSTNWDMDKNLLDSLLRKDNINIMLINEYLSAKRNNSNSIEVDKLRNIFKSDWK